MGYTVLNLSKQEIRLKNVINLFVPYAEVPNYLNAADIGVVWRNNDIVNNVSSPVKFSEYVCCGLPVIANDGVCLIKNYLLKTGYGKLVKTFDDINATEIKKLTHLDRNKISQYACQLFSVKVIANNYIKIYDNLLSIN